MRDSPFLKILDEKNKTFYQIRYDSQFNRIPELPFYAHTGILILLDENVKTIVRETYTISDVMASTGGFIEMISLTIIFLIGSFQSCLYY